MKEIQLELIDPAQAALHEPLRVAINQGRQQLGLPTISPALWEWRLRHPGGAHLAVRRDALGQVRAALLGLAHPARLAGESVRFLECLELFQDREKGRELVHSSPLSELCKAFASHFGGRGPEAIPVMYGWPTRRAHRYLLSQEKAEVLRSEERLRADEATLQHWSQSRIPGLELVSIERFEQDMEAFFERFAEGREALLVRDAERLNWRFAEHPEREYACVLVKRAGELVGYGVLRMGENQAAQLVECIALDVQSQATQALLGWAARWSLEQGASSLVFGVSTWSPEYRQFQGLGFRVEDSEEYMLFRSFQKPFIMSWLFRGWFYSAGDLERG